MGNRASRSRSGANPRARTQSTPVCSTPIRSESNSTQSNSISQASPQNQISRETSTSSVLKCVEPSSKLVPDSKNVDKADGSGDLECCICFEEVPDYDRRTIWCGKHQICNGCLLRWVLTEGKTCCPICREETSMEAARKACGLEDEDVGTALYERAPVPNTLSHLLSSTAGSDTPYLLALRMFQLLLQEAENQNTLVRTENSSNRQEENSDSQRPRSQTEGRRRRRRWRF